MMGTRRHPLVSNQAYFVTAATSKRRPVFRNGQAAELMLALLERARAELKFALLAYVVMPDHIHLIAVPGEAADLSRIMQSLKGRFARLWNNRSGSEGSLWQARYYESAVRTEAQLRRWLEYVDHNPVDAGLAESPEGYPYCSRGGKLATDIEAYLSGSWASRAEARPSG